MIFILILFLILGMLMVIKPELWWKIRHFIDVKDGEPTEISIMLIRIGGIIYIILDVILCLILAFYLK